MEIVEITRGHVRVRVGARIAEVGGEMLIPTPGLSDFLLYRDSVRNWGSPFEAERIAPGLRDEILKAAWDALSKLGRVVEVV